MASLFLCFNGLRVKNRTKNTFFESYHDQLKNDINITSFCIYFRIQEQSLKGSHFINH